MNKLLSRYFEEKFFLIPIRKNDKRPLFRKWNQYSLSYNEAKQYIKNGYNLGVVAKDFWILDYDWKVEQNTELDIKVRLNPIEFYRMFETSLQFTPRGFHVYLKGKIPKIDEFNSFKPDTVRHGDMYALVAPSKVDGKSYWWLDNMKQRILEI